MRLFGKAKAINDVLDGMGFQAGFEYLVKGLQTKEIKADEFSMKAIMESFIRDPNGNRLGSYIGENLDVRGNLSETAFNKLNTVGTSKVIMESNAADAVSTDAFGEFTNQVMYARIQEKYQNSLYNLGNMVEEVPSVSIEGDVIPGVANVGPARIVGEGDPNGKIGLVKNLVKLAPPEMRTEEIAVTWQMGYYDHTYTVLNRADEIADAIKLGDEEAICKVLADVTVGANADGVVNAKGGAARFRYNWNPSVSGGPYAPYQTAISNPKNWINDIASGHGLGDQTDLNALWVLLTSNNNLVGYPIGMPLDGWKVVCTQDNYYNALRIANSIQLRTAPSGATSVNPQMISNGDFTVPFEVAMSPILKKVLSDDSQSTLKWYFWNPKSIKKSVAMPLTVAVAPSNTGAAFHRNYIYQAKVGSDYNYSWYDPRFSGRSVA